MKSAPTLVGDQIKIDAYKFLNYQIKANKILQKRFNSLGDVYAISRDRKIHLGGDIRALCDAIDEKVIREDWNGNEQCNTNCDIIYFDYKGYRFFQLIDKEEYNDWK